MLWLENWTEDRQRTARTVLGLRSVSKECGHLLQFQRNVPNWAVKSESLPVLSQQESPLVPPLSSPSVSRVAECSTSRPQHHLSRRDSTSTTPESSRMLSQQTKSPLVPPLSSPSGPSVSRVDNFTDRAIPRRLSRRASTLSPSAAAQFITATPPAMSESDLYGEESFSDSSS